MTTFTYPLPDPAATAAKLKAEGVSVDPTQPTGQASYDGVTLAWAIADGSITVTVEHKPFYVSESAIKSHLDGFFGGAA